MSIAVSGKKRDLLVKKIIKIALADIKQQVFGIIKADEAKKINQIKAEIQATKK